MKKKSTKTRLIEMRLRGILDPFYSDEYDEDVEAQIMTAENCETVKVLVDKLKARNYQRFVELRDWINGYLEIFGEYK